ncbi:MAG: hypothetical protein AB1430_20665 [Pseudomonadota bacterium]
MAHIYRKTDKGHAEIETRAHRLAPRLRSALILVDGKRSDEDLRKLIPQEPDETLRQLLEQGFIELIATTAAPKAAAHAPAAAPAPERETEKVMSVSPSQLEQIKRESVRSLNNHLGPMAETLAMKIERARNMAELRPLLETASQIILNASGTGAAADFTSRFLEPYGG